MATRKLLIIFLLTTALIGISLISYKIRDARESVSEFGKNLFDGKIPIDYITIIEDYSILKNSKYNNTILVLFDPECEACFKQIASISLNKQLFNRCHLVFASTADPSVIIDYANKFDLSGFSSLKIGILNASTLKHFAIPYPTVILYDKSGYFLKGFKGGATIEQIVP
ncbi:MAG: hypothetical protein JNJ65_07795 [Cyclobacteriaceae bacterium]|nr:hypothetical protein [Cyclobacteriaceae bacterium]